MTRNKMLSIIKSRKWIVRLVRIWIICVDSKNRLNPFKTKLILRWLLLLGRILVSIPNMAANKLTAYPLAQKHTNKTFIKKRATFHLNKNKKWSMSCTIREPIPSLTINTTNKTKMYISNAIWKIIKLQKKSRNRIWEGQQHRTV